MPKLQLPFAVALVADGARTEAEIQLRDWLPETTRLQLGEKWPEAPADGGLALVLLADDKLPTALPCLAMRKWHLAVAEPYSLPPTEEKKLRERLKRLKARTAVLGTWKYHWTVAHLQEIMTSDILGNISDVSLTAHECEKTEVTQWLKIPAELLRWTPRENNSEIFLKIQGSAGTCQIHACDNGWGKFDCDSINRAKKIQQQKDGMPPIVADLAALAYASPEKYGWTGIKKITV